MIINLYKITDDKRVINKNLIGGVSINVNFKRDLSLNTPEIYLNVSNIPDIEEFNYIEIVDLNRFFFIDSQVKVNSKIVLFNCSIDVLKTYESDILNNSDNVFLRNIRSGDYLNIQLESNVFGELTNYVSEVEVFTDKSMVLTTVGVLK